MISRNVLQALIRWVMQQVALIIKTYRYYELYKDVFQHFTLRVSSIGSSYYYGSSMWIAQVKGQSKAIPLQAWRGPYSCRSRRLPEFINKQHMKVVRFSPLGTARLYPPTDTLRYSYRLEDESTRSAAGRI